MQITLTLNGVRVSEEIAPDMLLIDFVRAHGCKSVKRGCETSNCGLCTVFMDDKPVLSCSVLAARADGHKITTLEGLQWIEDAGIIRRCYNLSAPELPLDGNSIPDQFKVYMAENKIDNKNVVVPVVSDAQANGNVLNVKMKANSFVVYRF